MGRLLASIALGALTLACGGSGPAEPGAEAGDWAPGTASLGGDVVGTVDGHGISREMVARAARSAPEVPVEEVLRRLEDEELLAAAAARAGLAGDPGVERAVRQAMVQELLREAVEEVAPRTGAESAEPEGTEAELLAALEADPSRWRRPELRRTAHLLVSVPEGAPEALESAARAFVEARHRELGGAEEPGAALLALRRRLPTELPFEVVIEEVPPLPRDAEADPEYLRAAFALSEPGLAPAPVRTSFGWHVLVVEEIAPALEVPREEALEVLRRERLAAARMARLGALLEELAQRAPVELDPRAAHERLTALRLPGEAP